MHPDRMVAPRERIANIGDLNVGDRIDTVHFEGGVYYQTMRSGSIVEKHEDPPLITVEFRELRDGRRLRESLGHGTKVVNWGPETVVPRPSQPSALASRVTGLPRIGGHVLPPGVGRP